MRRLITLALSLALLVAGFATGAVLATDDPNVIHGCVNNNTLRLRVVGSPEDCTKQETPLDWNKQGEEGPRGPQGPEGPQGPPGPDSPVHPLYVALAPGETRVRAFDNGFSIEMRCSAIADAELWVRHGTQWYDNTVAGLLTGPERRYAFRPSRTELEITSTQAFATGLDGALLHFDRLDLIVPAPASDGSREGCIFAGFVATA